MGNYWSQEDAEPKTSSDNQTDVKPQEFGLAVSKAGRRYGWKRDRPDDRDSFFLPVAGGCGSHELIKKIDLRAKCAPIQDQGDAGSCTGNATASAYWFDDLNSDPNTAFPPSRLFLYFNGRRSEGTTNSDSGAEIRDVVKGVAKWGVCSEGLWPYDLAKLTTEPTEDCYDLAKFHHAVNYRRIVQIPAHIRGVLIEGFPIIFGCNIYKSFETDATAKTGIVIMPKEGAKPIGGHCMLIVGYDDDIESYIVQNSWGKDWGDEGFCYMPYDYIHNIDYSSDFWVLQRTSDM